MRRALALAAVVVLAAPGAAAAQGTQIVGAVHLHSDYQFVDDGAGGVPVRASGSLVVEWSSDPETCAPVGRCGVEGVTAWRVPGDGSLHVHGRGRDAEATLYLSDVLDGLRASAWSRVRRGTRVCADVAEAGVYAEFEQRRGRLPVGFDEETISGALTTRCGGPVAEDVAGAIPSLAVPAERLRRGRTTLRLGGTGTFAAHGLRGTVRSTLALRLGAPRAPRARHSPGGFAIRQVVNPFRVAAVTGEVALDVAGSADERECAPLDSCGLGGVVRLVPRLTRGSGNLVAFAAPRVPRARLRAAVGLAGGRRARALAVGGVTWAGPGLLVSSVGRSEDAVPCRDSVALRRGGLSLSPRGATVRVAYEPLAVNTTRTRCPGPALGAAARPLATADVPLAAFGRRRVEIALTGPARFEDDGWSVAARPSLTVVLERLPAVERVLRP